MQTPQAGRWCCLIQWKTRSFARISESTTWVATIANVTVRLLDKNGLSLGTLAATVPPGGLTQLNSINTTLAAGASPANREGYLRLEADQNIVGWTSQIDNLTQDPSLVVGKGRSAGETADSFHHECR